MTNSEFYNCIKKYLKKDGVVNLKTDSEFMHGYTLGLLHGKDTVSVCKPHVYVMKAVGGVTDFQTLRKTILEINNCILD
jgi:tRNA (guanine-N7-)-methyltransferase